MNWAWGICGNCIDGEEVGVDAKRVSWPPNYL